MKIIFCINQLSKGGAERVVCNVANYLCVKNEVIIVSLTNTKISYDIDSRIKVIMLDDQKQKNKIFNNLDRLKKLKKVYVEENADVVLSFLPESCFLTLMLKKYIKSKIIISVRNDPKVEYKNIVYKVLMKLLYKKADGVVFQTADAKKYFSMKIQNKSKIIFNSLNPIFVEEPFNGDRDKTIVSVGRLNPQKNQKILILAFSKIHDIYPDYKLIIYGEGPLRCELQELISKLGLNDFVLLPGVVDDVKSKIYKAGIFVMSSDYEGMPNALMEALSLGLPCISTDCPCGGPKTLIKNNYNGLLTEVGNIDMLFDKIKFLIDNEEECKRLSDNSNYVREKFDPSIINKEWENYIIEIFRGDMR